MSLSQVALIQEKQRFQILLDNMNSGLLIIEEGFIVDCNTKALQIIGYNDKSDLLRKTLGSLSPIRQLDGERSIEKSEKMMNQCVKEQRHVFKWLYQKADGRHFFIEVVSVRVDGQENPQIYIFWSDPEVNSKANLMEWVVESSLNEIYIFDAMNFQFQHVNQGARNNLGYSTSELLTMTAFDLKPNFTEEALRQQFKPLISGEVSKLTFTTFHQRKDGSQYPVEVHIQLLDFDTLFFVSIVLDITERRNKESRLLRSEMNLKKAQKMVKLGSWGYDVIKDEADWTEETYHIYEIDYQLGIRFSTFLTVVHPADRKRIQQCYLHFIRLKQTSYKIEYRLLMQDQSIKHIVEQGEILYDNNDQPRRSFGTVQDISVQKQHELTLVALTDKANEANRAKSEFLANMSHELRTPMHSILSFSKFGIRRNKTVSTEKLLRYFECIHESGLRLLSLLEDLFDLSKLEAGKIDLVTEENDLVVLFNTCYMTYESQAKVLGLSIQIESTVCIGTFDKVKIGMVIKNILSNAIKFSPENSVIVVRIKNEVEYLHFSLKDQGIGLPEAELQHVFDAFIQSSKTKTSAGGTGLGLAICKHIINAHSGRIWVENNPEQQGAVFHFTLPI